MWPDRVSNPGPLTHESGALQTALRGPAKILRSQRTVRDFEIYCSREKDILPGKITHAQKYLSLSSLKAGL